MRLSTLFLLGLLIILPINSYGEEKKEYGVFEMVSIPEIGIPMIKSKLDTGAVTSSLGASDIEVFKKDDEDWVRFTPQYGNADTVERPIVRHSNIKLRVAESEQAVPSIRPVVILNLCFDGKIYPAEVNLADRSRFNYPLLIGRNTLIDFGALINPSLRYQADTGCK